MIKVITLLSSVVVVKVKSKWGIYTEIQEEIEILGQIITEMDSKHEI